MTRGPSPNYFLPIIPYTPLPQTGKGRKPPRYQRFYGGTSLSCLSFSLPCGCQEFCL